MIVVDTNVFLVNEEDAEKVMRLLRREGFL